MFTGLIEEVGTIAELRDTAGSVEITIQCAKVLDGLEVGDSIAVNGVCLTATGFSEANFFATATPETLSRSSLGALRTGAMVNLERSLTLQSRLGGHMVQGHVDGTGKVLSVTHEGDSQRWEIGVPPELLKLLIFKGSVAINGVSLTVASLSNDSFSVALIPKTIEMTTFQCMNVSECVNIEIDMIGKYVFRYMEQTHTNT